MKRIISTLVLLLASLACSAPWYSSVAIDRAGNVCAGSIGAFATQSGGMGYYPKFTGGFLYCQNGHVESLEYGLTDLVMFGVDSVLYSKISYVNSDAASIRDYYDSSVVTIGVTSIYGSSLFTTTSSYIAFRGILLVNADSILIADRDGLSANNFSMTNPRAITDLPSQLSSQPIQSIARDFKGRLWVGSDSGVWIQNEATSSWKFQGTGWPVRNIFPMDTNEVVATSYHSVLDGYSPDSARQVCFENDTVQASCSIPSFTIYCPYPGKCYTANEGYLQDRIQGVLSRQIYLPNTVDLALAPNGKLWAATGNGLYSIDTSTFVATREYLGLDTPVVALPRMKQNMEWNLVQQGRQLFIHSSVAGWVELIGIDGTREQRMELKKGSMQMLVPHAGVWLLRWTPCSGNAQSRRLVMF